MGLVQSERGCMSRAAWGGESGVHTQLRPHHMPQPQPRASNERTAGESADVPPSLPHSPSTAKCATTGSASQHRTAGEAAYYPHPCLAASPLINGRVQHYRYRPAMLMQLPAHSACLPARPCFCLRILHAPANFSCYLLAQLARNLLSSQETPH